MLSFKGISGHFALPGSSRLQISPFNDFITQLYPEDKLERELLKNRKKVFMGLKKSLALLVLFFIPWFALPKC